jgi:hypothetical protein
MWYIKKPELTTSRMMCPGTDVISAGGIKSRYLIADRDGFDRLHLLFTLNIYYLYKRNQEPHANG